MAQGQIPKLPIGTRLFAINPKSGEWFYINHADTWQGMPDPTSRVIENLELRCHEMRVLGFAQNMAWDKHGIRWKHLEKVSQEELLVQAAERLAIID